MFIASTPIPTETKTLFPNNPKIQQRNATIQAPPPTAVELDALLNQQDAPKQMPVKPNIAENEPKQ